MGVLKQSKRIAYLGGSFDPPHIGHVALAQAVINQGLADEVWLAPALQPPHKERRINDFDHRFRMVELAAAGLPGLKACRIEQELQLRPSYTVQVLAALQERFPDYQFALLIGDDMLSCFHLWKQAAVLVEKYRILTYPRCGIAGVTAAELSQHWPPESVEKLLAGRLKNLPFFEISSTNVRERLAKNENVDNIICRAVFEYIKNIGLYQCEEGENI